MKKIFFAYQLNMYCIVAEKLVDDLSQIKRAVEKVSRTAL